MKRRSHPLHARSRSVPTRGRMRGFTLIELLMAMGILAMISVFCITSIATQLEHRNRLEVKHRAYHSIHSAMGKLYDDLRNVYLVQGVLPGNMVKRCLVWRNAGKEYYLTTQNFQSFTGNSHQSNIAQVRYDVRDDEKTPGRKQLWRIVDTDLLNSIEGRDVGTPQLLVDDLAEFRVEFWNGIDFVKEGDWDTTQGETSQKLPKMARIHLESYMPLTEAEQQRRSLQNADSSQMERDKIVLETIVYILRSADLQQLKEPSKEYPWK